MSKELRIEKHGELYKAFDMTTGEECTEPRQVMMQLAYENDEILYLAGTKWRRKAASSTVGLFITLSPNSSIRPS